MRQQGLARELLHRSGTPVHPMSPLVKLVWFSRHEPELAGQVRWWAGLKDYVLHHLTGELVTELSSASGTGLLNLKSRNWDAQSLDLAGIDADQLPSVLPTTAVRKLTAQAGRELGLPGVCPSSSALLTVRWATWAPAPSPRVWRAFPRHQRRRADGAVRARIRQRRTAVLLCPH